MKHSLLIPSYVANTHTWLWCIAIYMGVFLDLQRKTCLEMK